MQPAVPVGHPDLDRLDLGYRPNPAGVKFFEDRMPHPPRLANAAPHWMGDGQEGDLMPYLALYEVEIHNEDGSVWKPKGEEPPYRAQTGNNCTSEGMMHVLDLLQCVAAARTESPDGTVPVVHRTCVEFTYAAGLLKANMRGDNGCYGAPMAAGACEVGAVTYATVGQPYEEDRSRLHAFANDPSGTVQRYQDKAVKAGKKVKIGSWDELCAALANELLVTIASNVGYNTPRDEKGICRRAGSWAHQMMFAGIIRSDGIETAVQFQSWGPNNPHGPTPFRIPTFSFRTHRRDVEAQLAEGDCWGIGLFPGFERRPLPNRWTNKGWGR
jgi:hypothetical protein